MATTPPGSPDAGDLWFESDEGDLHIRYDGTWVNTSATGAQGVQGAPGAAGAQGAEGDSGMNVNIQSGGGYTLVAADDQKLVTAVNNVTIPGSVFSVADAITVYNDANGAISIIPNTGQGVTLRYAGTSTTGTRTLSSKGIATIVCVASNEFVVSGAGLS